MPLTITTTQLPSQGIGAYCATLQAAGGVGPYQWAFEDPGNVPATLQLNANTGQIFGTIAEEGTIVFKVKVTDSTAAPAQTASKMLSILIANTSWKQNIANYLAQVKLWKVALLLFTLIVIGVTLYGLQFNFHLSEMLKDSPEATVAAIGWGIAGTVVLFSVFLWAAESPKHFLAILGLAGSGAAFGYLVAVFIAAAADPNDTLSQLQKGAAALLSGVIGVKILSLVDDLIKGDDPRILKLQYFVPVIAAVVGFGLSLAAFYTVKYAEAVQVVVSPEPGVLHSYSGHNCPKPTCNNGVNVGEAETKVQFHGAATSEKDTTVRWQVMAVVPYRATDGFLQIDPKSGILTVPGNPPKKAENAQNNAKTFNSLKDAFIESKEDKNKDIPPDALDWKIRAISNFDSSRYHDFRIRLCRDDPDCDPHLPEGPSSAGENGTAPKSSSPTNPTQPQTPARKP